MLDATANCHPFVFSSFFPTNNSSLISIVRGLQIRGLVWTVKTKFRCSTGIGHPTGSNVQVVSRCPRESRIQSSAPIGGLQRPAKVDFVLMWLRGVLAG